MDSVQGDIVLQLVITVNVEQADSLMSLSQGQTHVERNDMSPVRITDCQITPDQDAEQDQDAPPVEKTQIVPFCDMGDVAGLRAELEHARKAARMHLRDSDTQRATILRQHEQLQAVRDEAKDLRAALADRDQEIARLRAQLAQHDRPLPIRYLPAPAVALQPSQ